MSLCCLNRGRRVIGAERVEPLGSEVDGVVALPPTSASQLPLIPNTDKSTHPSTSSHERPPLAPIHQTRPVDPLNLAPPLLHELPQCRLNTSRIPRCCSFFPHEIPGYRGKEEKRSAEKRVEAAKRPYRHRGSGLEWGRRP